MDVDLEIANLREQVAAGKATFEGLKKLDTLITKRLDILQQMAKTPSQEQSPPAHGR